MGSSSRAQVCVLSSASSFNGESPLCTIEIRWVFFAQEDNGFTSQRRRHDTTSFVQWQPAPDRITVAAAAHRSSTVAARFLALQERELTQADYDLLLGLDARGSGSESTHELHEWLAAKVPLARLEQMDEQDDLQVGLFGKACCLCCIFQWWFASNHRWSSSTFDCSKSKRLPVRALSRSRG